MTKIKTPIYFDGEQMSFVDADGEVESYYSIADALNRTADLEKEVAELDKWRIALEGLTAQGSEFYNDLDACLKYIHKHRAYQHDIIKSEVKERKRIEAKLATAITALSNAQECLCNHCGVAYRLIDEALTTITADTKGDDDGK